MVTKAISIGSKTKEKLVDLQYQKYKEIGKKVSFDSIIKEALAIYMKED